MKFEAMQSPVVWHRAVWLGLGLTLTACGGGTGNERDSGSQQTTLSVAATDDDGDTLSYQWRVTAGTIDNRNANQTAWTLPTGPGLHFAYVTVSDGKGGYAEQQYAVSSDPLGIAAPIKASINRVDPVFTGSDAGTGRMRFVVTDRKFVPASGGSAVERYIYTPSIQVELRTALGAKVFAGVTDDSGEVQLPPLTSGVALQVFCGTSRSDALVDCGNGFTPTSAEGAPTIQVSVKNAIPPGNNLRLHGHVAMTDGGVCGTRDEFAGIRSAGTVQVIDVSGSALTPQVEINRFGDYAIDAPVLVKASLKLKVRCESLTKDLDITAPSGFTGAPIELSTSLSNSRPSIVKMVANGPDGNVRGRMVLPLANDSSNGLPGPDQFLAFKGKDTRLGACMYYKSFGAVEDCDSQGNLVNPLSLDDWKRKHRLQPYATSNTEVKATYINQMDLNLVRRMVATQSSPNNIAFYVCNSPGPDGTTQREVNDVISSALAGEREVACVAMEWSVTKGVNGDKPFTKFMTFGPDGSLLLSVNLDGRGEKFMPGTCVACHGGTHYSGKFPDKPGVNASPFLGSAFLAFDTGNYLFNSDTGLRKEDQQTAFKDLNLLVRATEGNATDSAIRNLVDGWYLNNRPTLNEGYVPPTWMALDNSRPGAARVYREVVGSSCRTCHAAFKGFDWDSQPARIVVPTGGGQKSAHVCGGSPDVLINASMPNALTSRNRVLERVQADASLSALMTEFFGCTTALPDPAYGRR